MACAGLLAPEPVALRPATRLGTGALRPRDPARNRWRFVPAARLGTAGASSPRPGSARAGTGRSNVPKVPLTALDARRLLRHAASARLERVCALRALQGALHSLAYPHGIPTNFTRSLLCGIRWVAM